MQNDGPGRLVAFDACGDVKRAGGFGDPLGSGYKERPLAAPFHDEQSVEADVIDVNSVRQIAPGIFLAAGNSSRKAVTLDLDLNTRIVDNGSAEIDMGCYEVQ